MPKNLVAKASISVRAASARVWEALVNPQIIRQYMFGATVVSDWREGSPIVWKGEWQGKSYEDKGVILQFKPVKRLQYSHFSPLSGLRDSAENYHTVTIDLSEVNGQTTIALSQDNNFTEEARDHSQKNWELMLVSLKRLVEGQFPSDRL